MSSNNLPKVLLAEDDWNVVTILRFCLREAGFDVTEATTKDEAIRTLMLDPPDAIIVGLSGRTNPYIAG